MSDSNQKKVLVKNVNFAAGVSVLGSKQSLQASKNNEIEMTDYGIKAYSKSTGRTVVVPFSNITGMELITDHPQVLPVIQAPARNLVQAKAAPTPAPTEAKVETK